jgi:YidC/Oxa1 family membrane protein insertase
MVAFFNAILYDPMYNLLMWLVYITPGHQVGWAIIVITVIIRFALLPLTIHTAKIQVKTRLLQPKIDELRKQHKEDKTLQSQALMALYKEEGVSPFSSCLPMIVQLIVLVILYNVFRNGLTTEHLDTMYRFMPRPESLNTNFFGINLASKDLWVLPILAGLTQIWLSKVTFIPSNNPDDPMAAASKQMIYIFPIMTFIFARSMPAALPLYWIITNIFSIVQQQYVLKKYGLVPSVIEKEAKRAEKIIDATEHKSLPTPVKTEKKKGGVTVSVKKKS